jgi:hypothetical protein
MAVSAVRYVRYMGTRACKEGELPPWETTVRYVIAGRGCTRSGPLLARDPLYLTHLTYLTVKG